MMTAKNTIDREINMKSILLYNDYKTNKISQQTFIKKSIKYNKNYLILYKL